MLPTTFLGKLQGPKLQTQTQKITLSKEAIDKAVTLLKVGCNKISTQMTMPRRKGNPEPLHNNTDQ